MTSYSMVSKKKKKRAFARSFQEKEKKNFLGNRSSFRFPSRILSFLIRITTRIRRRRRIRIRIRIRTYENSLQKTPG